MSDDLLKMRHHKLLFELKFLYADLNYHQTIADDAARDFQATFLNFCEEKDTLDTLFPKRPSPVEISPPASADSEKIYDPPKSTIDKEVKNLHKKIASLTHPDKVLKLSQAEKTYREGIFLKASAFANANDLFALQQLALELGIELAEPTAPQLELFEEEAQKIKKQIHQMQNTYAWHWHHNSDPQEKDKIMTRYHSAMLNSLSKKEE